MDEDDGVMMRILVVHFKCSAIRWHCFLFWQPFIAASLVLPCTVLCDSLTNHCIMKGEAIVRLWAHFARFGNNQ
jgi:hypothetical protein